MEQLKVVTWNLGFGAMGAEADVAFEGGKKYLPSTKDEVLKNLDGIEQALATAGADIYLLQELTKGSILSRWQNVRKAAHTALPQHHSNNTSVFSIPFVFDALKNEHGMATFVHEDITITQRKSKLFHKGERYYGILPRFDAALTTFTKTPSGKSIAFINTHLSSFDPQGAIRMSQFLELITYVEKLSSRGYAVVVGADWNMYKGPITFIGNDRKNYEKYLHEFPTHLLPEGWTAHFPTNAPTLRAANRPYEKGLSSVATIDGFICSPEINVHEVTTTDLDFEYSDHNPVVVTMSI